MTACLDVGGLADCFIGYHQGKAGEEILDTYAKVRRDIFLKYVDARSIKNLNRVSDTDPWTILETDKFFGILKELNKDKNALREFMLKDSSIEYDFTQHYDRDPGFKKEVNGGVEQNGVAVDKAAEVQLQV